MYRTIISTPANATGKTNLLIAIMLSEIINSKAPIKVFANTFLGTLLKLFMAESTIIAMVSEYTTTGIFISLGTFGKIQTISIEKYNSKGIATHGNLLRKPILLPDIFANATMYRMCVIKNPTKPAKKKFSFLKTNIRATSPTHEKKKATISKFLRLNSLEVELTKRAISIGISNGLVANRNSW